MQYQERFQQALKSQGFCQEERLFEPPKFWSGGKVMQTGGFILCRIWRTFTENEHSGKYGYEVIYGKENGVGIQRYKWNEDYAHYEYDEILTSIHAEENEDEAKAQCAKILMVAFNHLGEDL